MTPKLKQKQMPTGDLEINVPVIIVALQQQYHLQKITGYLKLMYTQ